MKPSGIEWIGDIPDDWEVRRVKNTGKLIGGSAFPDEYQGVKNEEIPFIKVKSLAEDPISRNGKDSISESIRSKLNAEKFIIGSVVFAKVGAALLLQRFRILEFESCIDNNMMGFIPLVIEPRFFKYVTVLFDFSYFVNPGTVPSINQEQIGNIKIPFPPLKTQQKIADYLDEKCGEIDATISKQKESIEKLKAYKQSLISETVTKGLDKSAPLKPSGIEWIGDIPAHWEVCKIKNHCNLKTGSTPSSKDLSMFDGTENWFTPSDFTENYMLKNSLRRLNAKVFDQNLVPIFPPLSVLIVGIGATTGKVGFTTSKSSSNQQITAIIPKDKNIFPKFLLFWMIANTKMIRETALFTTLPILNNDTLGNATLLIPPYKEQLELASYIENKNIEIDVIINKKQNIIQKLDTYKKSIIFECVTGKTDL